MISLNDRIYAMAKRWKYTKEEYIWALKQAKIKPEAWEFTVTDDENRQEEFKKLGFIET